VRKVKLDKGFWLLLFIILVAIVASVVLIYKLKPNYVAEDILQGRQVVVQFLISDQYDLVHSELFCYDPTTGQSVMFNIPVDAGAWIRSKSRLGKISLLYNPGSPDKYIKAVETLTGVEIPYCIELSRESLSDLIDLVGGIDVFLVDPISMEFNGDIRMLPPGAFTMYGFQSLFYLQNLLPGETSSEFIKRQQNFLRLVLQKAGGLTTNLTSGSVKKRLFSLINTNFDRASVVTLLGEFQKLDSELMQLQKTRGTTRVVDGVELFLPQKEGVLLREQVRQITKALKDESFVKKELLNLNLEILNSTDRNLLAAKATDYYQSYGYKVVVTGNSEKALDLTVVYARNTKFLRAATRIADIINCKNVLVMESDPKLAKEGWNGSDVVIILGGDYDNFSCRR